MRRVHGVEPAHERARTLPPVRAQKGVSQDSEQPRFEVRAWGELVRRLEGARVGLLHEILGVGLVTGEVTRQVVQGVDVGQGLPPETGTRILRAPRSHRSMTVEECTFATNRAFKRYGRVKALTDTLNDACELGARWQT